VLVAEDAATGRVVGTVQVILAMPENQPHRAEVAKMLVRRDARCRGLGSRTRAARPRHIRGCGDHRTAGAHIP
jgi:hypothetical protein